MAASPSPSPSGLRVWRVDLYNQSFVKQASVDVPVLAPPSPPGPPPLVLYLGQYYIWSDRQFQYTQVTPYTPQADLGAPALSVLARGAI